MPVPSAIAGATSETPVSTCIPMLVAQGAPAPVDGAPPTLSEESVVFSIFQGTAATTGDEFFQELCRHLARGMGVRWAAITEFVADRRLVRTLAFWAGDHFFDNFEYPLPHTPCERVIAGDFVFHPSGVRETYPEHHELREFGIESYMGVPLLDREGNCLGHLYVMDDRAMPPEPRNLAVFRIFASRATSELIRVRAIEALRTSEQRFQTLAESSPTVVFRAGPDGAATYVNGRWESVLGMAPGSWQADGWAGAVHPDERDEVIRDWREAVAARRVWEREFRFQSQGGREGWVLARAVPHRDERGNLDGFIGTATDITGLKRAEHMLRESERRFRAVLDSSMDAVIAFDRGMRIGVFNAAAERILRCPAAEAAGTSVRRFLSSELAEALGSFLHEAGESGGGPRSLPDGLRAVRADRMHFLIAATLARTEVSGAPLFTLTLRDIEELERARVRLEELNRENAYLKEQAELSRGFDEIIGRSPGIRRVLESVELVAPTDSTVLIQGQTGTGKELIARAVHERSARRGGPFVKVNCAALPAGLVESEFFGHEKGAFTGAVASRRGRFELAHGGTIFLDEVGEVSPEVQVKLLRVLQESEFERVGGSSTIHVNVRVIAATNRDLAREVEQGKFRADLFYRLSVFPLSIPPLRDRAEDIPALVAFFVGQHAAAMGKKIEHIDEESMTRLRRYAWPGNIRELRNVLERAVILCSGNTLTLDDPIFTPGTAQPSGRSQRLQDMERDHIRAVLESTRGAIAGPHGAAAILGLAPSTLRSRMARLGITR